MKNSTYYIERGTAIIAAIVLLQTLYFKFTAHPDSVYIFTTLGIEPYGRIGSGGKLTVKTLASEASTRAAMVTFFI